MRRVLIVEDDPSTGHVMVTVEGEERPAPGAKVTRLFDLVEEAVRDHFHPVRTFFKPVRKAKRS